MPALHRRQSLVLVSDAAVTRANLEPTTYGHIDIIQTLRLSRQQSSQTRPAAEKQMLPMMEQLTGLGTTQHQSPETDL
jgi:hypothetical protein